MQMQLTAIERRLLVQAVMWRYRAEEAIYASKETLKPLVEQIASDCGAHLNTHQIEGIINLVRYEL